MMINTGCILRRTEKCYNLNQIQTKIWSQKTVYLTKGIFQRILMFIWEIPINVIF